MITGIILAAGKGTRLKCKTTNKTALQLNGKPLIQYGVDLMDRVCGQTVIVVGAFADSVKRSVRSKNVSFVEQKMRLGTGHAVKKAVEYWESQRRTDIETVLVGYGDHMMAYQHTDMVSMILNHQAKKAAVSLVSTNSQKANQLAWGRIVRDPEGQVLGIVEQKDATEVQKKITELNAGFYCFNWGFLKKSVKRLKRSPVTGEYYLTDLIQMAVEQGDRVYAHEIPFERIGLGINTREQLEKMSQVLVLSGDPKQNLLADLI